MLTMDVDQQCNGFSDHGNRNSLSIDLAGRPPL